MFKREGLRPRVPGAKQDGEISHLLRNLVRGNRERGRHAERHGRQHGRGDQGPVDKRMKRVADDHQRRRAARVDLAFLRVVAMTPEHELFEQKKHQHAAEQGAQSIRRRQRRQRLGQQGEQRHPEQRPDGVTNEPGDESDAESVADEEKRGSGQEPAEAPEHAEPHGGCVCIHRRRSYFCLRSSLALLLRPSPFL